MVERVYLIEVYEKEGLWEDDEDCKVGEAVAIEAPNGRLEYIVIDSASGSSISGVGDAEQIANTLYEFDVIGAKTKDLLKKSLEGLYKDDFYPRACDIAEHLSEFFNASVIEVTLNVRPPWNWDEIAQGINIISTAGINIS